MLQSWLTRKLFLFRGSRSSFNERLMLWVRISIRARCSILCDKVCQWFSPGIPVCSTNKTDRHAINEILLKIALNIIKSKQTLTTENSEKIMRKEIDNLNTGRNRLMCYSSLFEWNLTWIRVCSNQQPRYWYILHFSTCILCSWDERDINSIWNLRLKQKTTDWSTWLVKTLHVLMRCDSTSTSAFRGIEKVKLIYILQKEP